MNNNDPFVVRHITFDTIRLLDHNIKFHNGIKTIVAQRMARDAGLDLVCFNLPNGKDLAFCKIIDFNKWKYETEKKHRQEEKVNKKQNKEIRFSPNIADHDIEHKMRQVNDFLDKGDDVILTMKLRGREKCHFDMAEDKMNKIVAMCLGHGKEISRKKTSDLIIIRVAKNHLSSKENKIIIKDESISNEVMENTDKPL